MADFLFTDIPNQNIRSGTDLVQTSGHTILGLGSARYVCDARATATLHAAHPRFVARSSNGRYWRALPEAGRIAVEVGGALGDGTSDDGPAIRAAIAYAEAIGARGPQFSSASYRVERILPAEATVAGSPPIQLLRANTPSQNHDQASFSRQAAGRGIVFHPALSDQIVELPLGANAVAGSRQVTLATGLGAQLTIGDTVLWQLGELPYDTPETLNWSFASVLDITGDTVLLDRPMPQSVEPAMVSGSNFRLRKLRPLRDWSLANLTLNGPAEEGLSIYCGERIQVRNLGGRNLGAGTIVAQYCDGLTIEDCWQDGYMTGQASFGFAFNLAETRNTVLLRPRARGTIGLVNAEAGAHATVIGGQFDNTLVDQAGQPVGSQVAVINAVGRGSVTVHDLTVTGFGGYRLLETSNGQAGYDGVASFSGTLRLNHPSAPFSIPLSSMTGTLDITIDGTREIYNFERLRHWRKRFVLRDGEYRFAYGPAGLLARARVYASPGVTIGSGAQLTGLWLGRQGSNGANLADGPTRQIESGSDVAIPTYAGLVAGAQWNARNLPLQILCTTAPNGGLNTANEFVEFEGWFAEQPDLDVVLSEDAVRASGVEADPFEAFFPAYDLPALAPGASQSITLSVPDMLASDLIDTVRFVGGLGGLELRGAEAQAGSARLILANPGTGTIDRAPTDLAIAFHRTIAGY